MDLERSTKIHQITANIQELNQYVQQLNQNVAKIGGVEDNERTRTNTTELIHKSNELAHTTNRMLKSMNAQNSADRQVRVQSERLMSDFMGVLNRLQDAKRKAANREKTQIRSVAVEDEQLNVQQRTGLEDPIQLQHLQQQHRLNINEIRERQQALAALEQDIGDVNQIFKDLAHMVHDQGDMVDSIEANIETASVQVQQGHVQVMQAHHFQTKARQKKVILGGVCCTLLLIFLIVFILWLRH